MSFTALYIVNYFGENNINVKIGNISNSITCEPFSL